MDRLEERLRERVRSYRRLLQKIVQIKTKILGALRDEGCSEAADILQAPSREAGATRCDKCIGCYTLRNAGPCTECPECKRQGECVEHTRLCFAWRQPTATFLGSSVVTGVSSLCNVREYELGKYKGLMDQLGEASLDIEAVLDEIPAGSHHHQQDRYNATRRTRDIQNEEDQLRTIEILLMRYQDERSRLDDLISDGEDEGNDAVEVQDDTAPPAGMVAPYGLLSQTSTHYQFNSPAPAGLQVEHLGGAGDADQESQGWGFGFGVTPQEHETFQSILEGRNTPVTQICTESRNLDTSLHLERPSPTIPASGNRTRSVSPPRKSPARQPPEVSRMSPTRSLPAEIVTRTSSVSLTTTTFTIAGSKPSVSIAATAIRTPPVTANTGTGGRRRSSSEGEKDPVQRPAQNVEKDQLFRIKQLVATRSQILSQDFDVIIARLQEMAPRSALWVNDELKSNQLRLTELEELESTAWAKIETLEGKSAQRARIEKWRDWLCRQTDKVRKIKQWVWEADAGVVPSPREDHFGGCSRSVGHVEKVKLPTFSGRQGDFSEFRNQFRELCRGEKYTPILEMAQLRLKLPKEALAAITGLQCPEEAWKRMEELYGNRELSILSALKSLREFKPAKHAPHEQVIELASAVQRCQTELKNVKALDELLNDRESIACIIFALPPTVRDKWYDREVPGETRPKAEFLLKWLETQRQNAVRVRLDTMAAQLRVVSTPSGPPARSSQQQETTDKGLLSSSLHAQGGDRSTPANPGQGSGTKPKEVNKNVPSQGGGSSSDQIQRIEVKTMADAQKIAERRQANLAARKQDKCPVCSQHHHYERTWPDTQPLVKTQLLSTYLTSCATFVAMSPEEKMAAVLGNAGCLHCASWDHKIHKFPGGKPTRGPTCSVLIGGNACGGAHGRWYHEGGAGGGAHSVVAAPPRQGPGLYEVYLAPIHPPEGVPRSVTVAGMIMVDPGSDTNFVRHDFARQLGLTGEPCQFRLKVVDREARPIQTARYQVEVEDCEGHRHTVHALGLETITVLPPDPDLTPIQHLVQGYPAAVLNRPQGEVDLLLGLRNSALHGSTEKQWGNLRLLKSPLGCGWSLRGAHPDLLYTTPQLAPSLSAEAYMLSQAEIGPEGEAQLYHIQGPHDFQELNELGTTPPPVCLKCRGCRECTFRRRRLTPEEQDVVARVESEMKVDSVSGVITAAYPWKNCVRRMIDNRRQAQRVQEQMERHMIEVQTHAGYVEEMQKSIKEGKVRRLTQQEMDDWHGPRHYITTFAVIKPESVSTKTRVVANSAMQNARARLSLNDCMWAGPNALCDLLDCLLFWRAVEIALMTDLKKAYQAIHTGPMELHLRRFLFRESRDQQWEDFAFTRATFGDLAAGLILEVAKRRVAELGQHIDPMAARQLREYSYVDDSLMGGSQEDADRMRGQRVNGDYTGTVPQILSHGAMKVKFMAVAGSNDPWEAEQLAGKTLGVQYRLAEDEIFFQVRPGFYAAKSKSSDQIRDWKLLGPKEVEEMADGSYVFTRRQALSMVMGIYDPLGLISPALLHGKILLRRLYGPGASSGWDADLSRDEKTRWANWFRTMLNPAEVVFPRSTKPKHAVGSPRLVGFGDASMLALCVCLYVVWTDAEGRHHPRLLTGKCRVSPLLGTTIPRGELQALVVLHRLVATVLEAFPFRFESVSTYTDSLCSLGAMSKTSTSLRPYFANRVLEILRIREQIALLTTNLAPISHIPGDCNPADLGTRGAVKLMDLGPGSEWQVGPKFLREDFELWPSTHPGELKDVEIPAGEGRVLFGMIDGGPDGSRQCPVTKILHEAAGQTKLSKSIQGMCERALSREKLELTTRALARALQGILTGRREACQREPSVKLVEIAVSILLRVASRSAVVALQAGKLCGLGAQARGDVVWVTGRIRGEQLATLLGTTALPVLLPSERLAYTLLHKAHREDHRRGPRDATARSRRAAWITSATRLAKTIAQQCHGCRHRDKKMEKQIMGPLPAERLEISAPFEATALDLFGPFWVKDTANGRRSFKCWAVCYVCMGAKAVCLLPCPGYGTDTFMTTHRFFTALYGRPKILYTDHAPSLIKAAETPNWDEISNQVGAQGTDWRLTAKGCSWRNGLAERVIRSARHTLAHELKLGEMLDFHQFGAVLSVVAAVLNSRPLSLKVTPEGEYHALAPRDILFGRAGRSLDAASRDLEFTLDLDQDVTLRHMCEAQAKIVRAWKRKWKEAVFPDMVARPKWRVQYRNVVPGDIGHVRYERKVGDHKSRLALVEDALPDEDGVVRTITVAFRPRRKTDTGKPYTVKSATRMTIGVQRFAVLMTANEMTSSTEEDAKQGTNPASETTLN